MSDEELQESTASKPAAPPREADEASEAAAAVDASPEAPAPEAPAPEDPPPPAEPAQPGAKAEAASEEPPLVVRGNPLRLLRGGLTAGLGSLFAFLLMAHNRQIRLGVPLGILFVAVAAWGVMDLLGTFDDAEEGVAARTTLQELTWPLVQVGATLLLFGFSLMGGQSNFIGQWVWGAVVTAAFLGLVAAVFDLGVKLGPWATDELGLPRPLVKRHGFWVLAIGALLFLPMMGNMSLWDPWETHYGEVAREILARDDWISLWWAQDGWFWSKPILNFWIQSVAMASLGTKYLPDGMLMGAHVGGGHPEWVVRAPNVLMTLVAMYCLYKGVARIFGRRAGLLGGVVLATMPDWYFLAHQTMTDMPFVSAMTAAMGLLLLGLHTDDDVKVRLYEVKAGRAVLRISGWHLVFGIILITAIPQILYLLSRNLELVLHGDGPMGFRHHWDEFRSGSGGGNCGLPGNEACTAAVSASIPKGLPPHPEGVTQTLLRLFGAFEPVLQGVLWSVLLGSLLYMNWGERRLRRLFYLGAWYAAALATMAKGPAGFALPMICAFAYVCTKRRFGDLLQMEMLSGLLIILAVALPWYVAMYVRHGSPFTDRLIFHDMFNRAFNHVHDTNEGDDTSFRFYIWQLGYACFPWTAFAPLGLVYWLRRGDSADQGRGDASVFLAMWFIFAFALFSFMGTKFHHYIFPAVPPVAMLIGVVLNDILGRFYLPSAAPVAEQAEVAAKNDAAEAAKEAARGSAGYRDAPTPQVADTQLADEERVHHERLMLGAAAVAGALLLALVGRDLCTTPEGADQPGAIRLLHLFTYNYRRPWPETLDFSTTLTVITVLGALLALAMVVQKVRHHAAVGFTVLALVAAFWGLDVYMVKTAPHWGQHELMQAYYQHRAGAGEPLVAYQMNWKGENFYTGNKVPAFVSSGATFTTWLKGQKDKGVKVMYFVTEHSRVGGLKSEVGGRAYAEVTDKALCNKFVLVRAEL